MSNSSLRFAHVAINCRDPLALEAFYTKHFGFQRARVADLGNGNQIVYIKSGGLYLEMFKSEGDAPYPAPAADGPSFPGWRHIAFQVDDVDAKLAELGGDGRVTLGPLRFDSFIPGWKTAWIADPEGNIIEISQGYHDQVNPPSPA